MIGSAALALTEHLVSMGLSDDWSFERAFAEQSGSQVTVFDPSVTGTFWLRNYASRIRNLREWRALLPPNSYLTRYREYRKFFDGEQAVHVREPVGYDDEVLKTISLDSIMSSIQGNRCFLKVDIEGAEYRILESIVQLQDRFVGIAMEFHYVDLNRHVIDKFIQDLTSHSLINIHPNNGGSVDPAGDPLLIELSWTRNDLLKPDSEANSERVRERLNSRNVPSYPDVKLRFE